MRKKVTPCCVGLEKPAGMEGWAQEDNPANPTRYKYTMEQKKRTAVFGPVRQSFYPTQRGSHYCCAGRGVQKWGW